MIQFSKGLEIENSCRGQAAGCSIMVVYHLGVMAVPVQFRTARLETKISFDSQRGFLAARRFFQEVFLEKNSSGCSSPPPWRRIISNSRKKRLSQNLTRRHRTNFILPLQ